MLPRSRICSEELLVIAWGRGPLRLLCDSTSLLRTLLPTSFSGIGPAAAASECLLDRFDSECAAPHVPVNWLCPRSMVSIELPQKEVMSHSDGKAPES